MQYHFYKEADYPLCRYSVLEMPEGIWTALESLVLQTGAVIRGGLAYILLTGDESYSLKDVDLVCPASRLEEIYPIAESLAEECFYSTNSHKVDMVSLFWKLNDGFGKIDVLFPETLPEWTLVEWPRFSVPVRVITPVELWRDRMCKIGEKVLRRHSDDKTRNHTRVAAALSKYILEQGVPLTKYELVEMPPLRERACEVLESLLTPQELEAFERLTEKVLTHWKEGC